MNNYKELYKLIDNLKIKIKKLDNNKSKTESKIESNIESYRIFCPKGKDLNKKYVALKFDNNFNDFSSDDSPNTKNLLSFIKLKKNNIVINYALQIDVSNISKDNQVNICSISLGIKSKSDSKIKIIKGSKFVFDLLNQANIIENKIQINNTILYIGNNGDELCMIGELTSNFVINYKKSLIKILFV